MGIQGEPPSIPEAGRGTITLRACIVFATAVGAFAALGAMRFGEHLGGFLPVAVAAASGLAAHVLFSILKRKTSGTVQTNVVRAKVSALLDENPTSLSTGESVPSGSEIAVMSDIEEEPDAAPAAPPTKILWPVETSELQIKLDLASSYVELGDTELAVQYLQEILEMELAISRKLGAEALKESRQPLPEDSAFSLDS